VFSAVQARDTQCVTTGIGCLFRTWVSEAINIFHPNAQRRLIQSQGDSPLDTFKSALATKKPWESIRDFTMHPSFCGQKLYPRQLTLLKLIYLETENMTPYDIDVIEEWREGFKKKKDVFGVQPDVWERVEFLKSKGYTHFPHVQAVLGRRAGKGFIGGILGAERIAYLHSLDSWQRHYSLKAGTEGWLQVFATSQQQAQRTQFADIRYLVEQCKYLQPWISTSKEGYFSIRTPADLRRIAELESRKVRVEREIASLKAIALSSNSATGRGLTTFCLDPETPILTADLRWVPLRSVQVGDELVAVDENPELGKQRKIRKTVVLNKGNTFQKSYRLTFDDGRTVTCSANHRWLVRHNTGGKNFHWRHTVGKSAYHSIKPGTKIVELVKPWENDDSRDAGYLAGAFDGEGHVAKNQGIVFTQNPGIMLDKVSLLMKEKGFNIMPCNSNAYKERTEKQCEQWALRGLPEVLRFLGQIRPERIQGEKYWEGISLRGGGRRLDGNTEVLLRTVVSVEELPEQTLIDLETSERTFIANGLVSHNSIFFDEMAHMIFGSGSTKSGEEIYDSAEPSLDQFGTDRLIYIPSSPLTKIGKFFELYRHGTVLMKSQKPDGSSGLTMVDAKMLGLTDDDIEQGIEEAVAEPEMLIFQGPSWIAYQDWERSKSLGMPKFKRAVQVYDERMQRLEQRNPEKFKVERRGQFADVQGAYLDPDKVDAMFEQPDWRPALAPQDNGLLLHQYRIHCDPGRTNANFALAIGHLEDAPKDEYGEVWPHVIFDYLKVWKPADFPDHTIDYLHVQNDISDILRRFPSTQKISFDMWNSAGPISMLRQEFSPRIRILEESFTEGANQKRAELFKSALNLGWIHSYRDDFGDQGTCLLEQEMKFLTEVNGKVKKQDFGPVTTKDLWDCVAVVSTTLLHEALDIWLKRLGLQGSFGSTDASGLRHGREFDRLTQAGMGYRGNSMMRQRLESNSLDRLRGRSDKPTPYLTRGGRWK
jgi:hypothetical protein